MKAFHAFILTLATLGSTPIWAQGLEVGIDWNMGAIVSSNDYTNGATDGTPSLSLAFDFEGLAAEIFYKNYKLDHVYDNSLGRNELEFDQKIFGLGVRLTHGRFLLSRLGLHYVDTQTKAVNSNGEELKFDFDEPTVGFYGGGGIQIPLTETLHFQTVGQLETSKRDLSVLTLLFGFRYQFTQL